MSVANERSPTHRRNTTSFLRSRVILGFAPGGEDLFHLKDTVRKAADRKKIGTVTAIRDMEPRYQIQFGKDDQDAEWIKDNDLELVAEADEKAETTK